MYIFDRSPAQEHVVGSSKIPTVLYYDKDGTGRVHTLELLVAQAEASVFFFPIKTPYHDTILAVCKLDMRSPKDIRLPEL